LGLSVVSSVGKKIGPCFEYFTRAKKIYDPNFGSKGMHENRELNSTYRTKFRFMNWRGVKSVKAASRESMICFASF